MCPAPVAADRDPASMLFDNPARALEGDLGNDTQRTERKEGSAEERGVLAAEYAQVIRERDRESHHRLGETAML